MRPLILVALAAITLAPAAAWASPNWTVDKGSSKLGFASAFSGEAFTGSFGVWDAQITFDPKNLPGSMVVATIEMGSARTGDPSRDEALPTADWFSAKVYPKATFTSRSITATGPGRYVANGVLSIRNVSRNVSLPFTLNITGDTARMAASVPLNRGAFGVGQAQWKTGESVPLAVQININVTARRVR
jgi:polyisoprenoid-binding protein YceI